MIIYRTWQYLTCEEERIVAPTETYYFEINQPVIDGYKCIGVSLQEVHGYKNGNLLISYTETLGRIYNPTDHDCYVWGAVFKFVYLKRQN